MADPIAVHFAKEWQVLDPQVAALLDVIYTKAAGQPLLWQLSPSEARRAISVIQFYLSAGAPALPHIETRTIAGASGPVRVRLYDPGVPAPSPTVVFVHGGGWVLCDVDIYDGVARQLAKRSGLRLLSVDYGLAPEHPFPVPVEDCVAAVRWAAKEGRDLGVDPDRLAIAGDSAGANLALATCLALRGAEAPRLRGAALIYGAYAASSDTPSYRENGGGAYLMSTEDMEWFWQHYLPKPEMRQNPLAAPLCADLSGLPPLHITASEFDVLRCDSEMLVERLKAIGAPFEFRLWKGMVHACLGHTGWIDAMPPEVDRIGAFLRRVTGGV